MKKIVKAGVIFLVFSCSIFSGCLGEAEDEITINSNQGDEVVYPNDISLLDGVPACADSDLETQPCPSGMGMRKITSSNGYTDWIGFDSSTLTSGEINQYDMNFDHDEFRFSRWSLSVSSSELENPHIFLDWISSDGGVTPVGGSTLEDTFSQPTEDTSEYKDERWLDVSENGEIIRTFQMTISYTPGVTLRAKVLDLDNSEGSYQMSITIYTNRKPVAEASLLSPSKVSQNSTIYVDGCKTSDPDFLGRQNDDKFGRLTWMLNSIDEGNANQRLSNWGSADCFLVLPLKNKGLAIGTHEIFLLARDSSTALGDDPDSIDSVEFEIVADEEYEEPELVGSTNLDTQISGEFSIDSMSPMQFIDLPFTRSDFSIGVGVRYTMNLESEGSINFQHHIDIDNNSFDISNASSNLDSSGSFRPWILTKYSVWDKTDRTWKDGEVEIPMISCASLYDDMPSFKTPSDVCPRLYYWDKAMLLSDFKDGNIGEFELDQTIDVAAFNLLFILDKLVSTNPALSGLLTLLNTIGDVEIPLSFGMNINAKGVMATSLDFLSNNLKLDGESTNSITLFGNEKIINSDHELSGSEGFISLSGKSETIVDVKLIPTIGLGLTYKLFGVTIYDYDYRWELNSNQGIETTANIYSTRCDNILWEVKNN